MVGGLVQLLLNNNNKLDMIMDKKIHYLTFVPCAASVVEDAAATEGAGADSAASAGSAGVAAGVAASLTSSSSSFEGRGGGFDDIKVS